MNIFFGTLILPLINTCILRKQKHCITYKILKNRAFPVFKDEELNESHDSQTLKRSFHDETDINANEPDDKRTKTNDSHDINLDKTLEVKPVDKHGNIDELSNESLDHKLNKIYKRYFFYNKNELEEFKNNYLRFLSGDIEGMYELLEFYLRKNIFGKQIMHYMLRIEDIKQKYKNLILNKSLSSKASLIFKPYHAKFISLLKLMVSDDWLKLQPLDGKFKIYSHINLIKEKNLLPLLNDLYCIKRDTLELYFNYELLKCIERSHLVPEVMVLGAILHKYCSADLIINIHLIRLLIENFSKNDNTDKLCSFLIDSALKYSNKRSLDIFAIENLKTVCLNRLGSIHEKNFYHLSWELEKNNRQNLKRVISNQIYLSKNESAHNNHLIFIDLMYLYQHVLLLKCKNGKDFKIDRKFITLFDDLFTKKNNCFACGFEELMEILKEQYTFNKTHVLNNSALS